MSATKNFPKAILITCTRRQYSAWKLEAKDQCRTLVSWVRYSCGREVRRARRRRQEEELRKIPLPPTGTEA